MVPWVADAGDAPDAVQHRALELAQVAEERGTANGRKPSGVAAACLYRAAEECEWMVIQDVGADAANVTPLTLRRGAEALGEALAD